MNERQRTNEWISIRQIFPFIFNFCVCSVCNILFRSKSTTFKNQRNNQAKDESLLQWNRQTLKSKKRKLCTNRWNSSDLLNQIEVLKWFNWKTTCCCSIIIQCDCWWKREEEKKIIRAEHKCLIYTELNCNRNENQRNACEFISLNKPNTQHSYLQAIFSSQLVRW